MGPQPYYQVFFRLTEGYLRVWNQCVQSHSAGLCVGCAVRGNLLTIWPRSNLVHRAITQPANA